MHHIDSFDPDDFIGGACAGRASALIDSLEDLEALCGLGKSDVLPIAVSSSDIDVMGIMRPHVAMPGKVLSFSGGLVDTYAGFDEWFLAMVDYNREKYQRPAAKNGV